MATELFWLFPAESFANNNFAVATHAHIVLMANVTTAGLWLCLYIHVLISFHIVFASFCEEANQG